MLLSACGCFIFLCISLSCSTATSINTPQKICQNDADDSSPLARTQDDIFILEITFENVGVGLFLSTKTSNIHFVTFLMLRGWFESGSYLRSSFQSQMLEKGSSVQSCNERFFGNTIYNPPKFIRCQFKPYGGGSQQTCQHVWQFFSHPSRVPKKPF